MFAIIIELPSLIKQELKRICIGLPSAEWRDEDNFYLCLKTFEKLKDTDRWDLMDRLGEIQAEPFFLKIHRLNFSLKRGNAGNVWAVLEPSLSLDSLKKKVDKEVRAFQLREKEPEDYTAVNLGSIQKESSQRMAAYFEANGEFTSTSFEVREFVWAHIQKTSKHYFYTVEKRYPLG